MANDLAKGMKDWWLGAVEEHAPDAELSKQFAQGSAPDAADLIRFEDGQTEVDTEFRNIYASNRAEDPEVDNYFATRDAFEAHEGVWSKLRTRIPYYIPIVFWLPKYKWKEDLISDIVTGIGVAAMLIPQSLAYALLAGVDPQYGLYTAFVRLTILPILTYHLSLHLAFGSEFQALQMRMSGSCFFARPGLQPPTIHCSDPLDAQPTF